MANALIILQHTLGAMANALHDRKKLFINGQVGKKEGMKDTRGMYPEDFIVKNKFFTNKPDKFTLNNRSNPS